MASYKDNDYVTMVSSDVFDVDHRPATHAPLAGIYRCTGCGREIVAAAHEALPTDHHHSLNIGSIRWRLIVVPNHDPH